MLSPNCKCAHPYTGVLNFFSFSFSDLQNLTYYGLLRGSLMSAFLSRGLPVDSVNLTNPTINIFSYLEITLQVFPSGQNSFDRASVSMIGFVLNRQQFPIPIDQYFGPLYFLDEQYCCFSGNMHCSSTFYFILFSKIEHFGLMQATVINHFSYNLPCRTKKVIACWYYHRSCNWCFISCALGFLGWNVCSTSEEECKESYRDEQPVW